jgi:glycosyltransferase involved in cell wall biosynthesis
MKIAVNTRLLIKDKLDGTGWFTHETLRRITAQHPEHEFYFLFDRPFSNEFIYSPNVVPMVFGPQARHPFLWYWWFNYSVKNALERIKADVFFSPDGFVSLTSKVPTLPVIHDLNFEHRPNDLPFLTRWYHRHYFPLFARHGKRIITVSEFSKKDIVNTYHINPSKVDVVYNGANHSYSPLSDEEKLRTKIQYTQGCDYFIFIGSMIPRKNLANQVLAFDEFKKGHPCKMKMVLIGAKWFKYPELENALKSIKHKDDIICFPWLTPDKLKFLMGSATGMCFVSWFEGFGIPIIEAMQSEIPVITSNITSMPEVAGDAALLADPGSVDSIKEAMMKIVTDETLRNHLITKGRVQQQKFNWDHSASGVWKSIEKCMEGLG